MNSHDLVATVILLVNQDDSLWVRYPATHTGKGKKLSGSVFYRTIQIIFLRVYETGLELLIRVCGG